MTPVLWFIMALIVGALGYSLVTQPQNRGLVGVVALIFLITFII